MGVLPQLLIGSASGLVRSDGVHVLRCSNYMTRRVTHGHCRHGTLSPTYIAWRGMWARCTNPNNQDFHSYGARGIKVCERWKMFENFLADIGEKPSRLLSLDRIDNDGNYELGNVRWATAEQQVKNRRPLPTTQWISFDGAHHNVAEWARLLGIKEVTLRARLRLGWSIKRALTSPIRHYQNIA